jgi:hypothetical protein
MNNQKRSIEISVKHFVFFVTIFFAMLVALAVLGYQVTKQDVYAVPAGVITSPLSPSKGGTGLSSLTVVNDLTTDSATSLLSAAQGKVLADKFNAEVKTYAALYPYATGNANDMTCDGTNPIKFYSGDWGNLSNQPVSGRVMGVITAYCRGEDEHMMQTFNTFYPSNHLYSRVAGNPISSSWQSWVTHW